MASNVFKQSYFASFIDVLGQATLRNDVSMNQRMTLANDASMGGNLFLAQTLYTVGGINQYSTSQQAYGTNPTDATVLGRLFVSNDLNIAGRLNVNEYTNNNIIYTNVTSTSYTLIIAEDLSLNGRLNVNYDASLNQRLFVGGDVSFNEDLYVLGKTILQGDVSMNSRLSVGGDLSLNGRIFLPAGGNIYVGGALFSGSGGNTSFFSDVSMAARLFVYNDVSMGGRLYVVNDASMTGNLYVGGSSGLQLLNNMNITGIISQNISTGAVTNVASTLNDATIAKRLFVSGDVSMNGNLYNFGTTIHQGDVSMNSRLFVGGDVSMNQRLFVGGDVSMNGNLYNLGRTIHQGDVSMNSKLFISGDVSMNSKLFVNGNVGINNSNPSYTLDVSGGVARITGSTSNINAPATLLLGTSTDTGTSRWISALNSNMTSNTTTYVTFGQSNSAGNQAELGFGWQGNNNGATNMTLGFHSGCNIRTNVSGYTQIGANIGATNYSSGLAANTFSSVIFVGNGTKTDGPIIITNVDGNNLINFSNAAGTGQKGAIASSNSTSVAYNTSSDARMKTNVTPMSSMIQKIKQLNPAHFVWKDGGIKDDGFIAQEVHKIFPLFIGSVSLYCDCCEVDRNDIYDGSLCSCCDWENPIDKNGKMQIHSLDYGKFTPYLTKALQETIELVETLQTKNMTLEAKIADLESKLAALEVRLSAAGF